MAGRDARPTGVAGESGPPSGGAAKFLIRSGIDTIEHRDDFRRARFALPAGAAAIGDRLEAVGAFADESFDGSIRYALALTENHLFRPALFAPTHRCGRVDIETDSQ